jgi:hypothetical protein
MKLNERETAKLKILASKLPRVNAGELKAEHFPDHSYEEVFAALYDCPGESREAITDFIMNNPRIKSTLEANKDNADVKSFTFRQLCKLYENLRNKEKT